MEPGLQLHLPTYSGQPLKHLLDLTEIAVRGGIAQVWVTDNLRNRNIFSVLAALSMRVPVKLGSAVMVQYFHNPVGAAAALACISELMEGRELSVGLGHGNPLTPSQVSCPRPVTMLRELASCLRTLLSGERADFEQYPLLASYFQLVPGTSFRLESPPGGPVTLYCGGNGPKSLDVGGRYMDGVLFGGSLLPAVRSGRLKTLFTVADTAAQAAGKPPLRKVAEVKLSVSKDESAAIEFARRQVSHWILQLRSRGYDAATIQSFGIAPGDLAALEGIAASGAPRSDWVPYVTDAMVHSVFIAGSPASCRPRLHELRDELKHLGVAQVMFSELGPDLDESVGLLAGGLLDALN